MLMYIADENNLLNFFICMGNNNCNVINWYNKDLLFNIFRYIPVHCHVCFNNHNTYDYYKKCISSTLSDISFLNDINIDSIDRNKIIKSILLYLRINNKCKKCNCKITNWYKYMDICNGCDMVLCSKCIKIESIQSTPPPGIFIYFFIFFINNKYYISYIDPTLNHIIECEEMPELIDCTVLFDDYDLD